MLSPSDFNNAVPQFTNGNYAGNPINPQYIEEPSAVDYNRGAEPLQTLPAQWWNWFLNRFTLRFNKLNIYVKNIFNELTQLLSLVSITPSGTEADPTVGQLKDMFKNEYPKYLALLMYPVGSIYWTGKAPDDGGDPNTLFGGTWVQIKGKFVWAKGDSDTLNATGGSKTVTLTEQQIPSHTHTFTGTAVTSSVNNRGHTHAQNMQGGSQVNQYAWVAGQRSGSSKGATINSDAYSVNNGQLFSNKYRLITDGESQNHTHSVTASGTNSSTGGGQAHENMPPYIVKYCWERTA